MLTPRPPPHPTAVGFREKYELPYSLLTDEGDEARSPLTKPEGHNLFRLNRLF